MKKIRQVLVFVSASILGLSASVAFAYANPAIVDLGGAGGFGVLSKVSISDTVPTATVITGDIGVSPAPAAAITGIDCTEVVGTIHVVSAGGATVGCQTVDPTYLTPTISEMEDAYIDALSRAPDETLPGDLSGLTLTPGVYFTASDLGISTDVNLDCSANADGVFIFQIGGNLSLAASTDVLTGSCNPANIFWAVAGTTTIGGGVGTESSFAGTVLGGPATTEISVVTGSTINGRLLGQKGIALDQNIITVPTATPPTTGPVFIDTNLNNTLDGGELFFQTIQAAVNTASTSGDTIYVSAGTYDEQVVIDGKDLILKGAGDTTIIRPSAPSKLSSLYTYPAGTLWPGTVLAGIVTVKNSANVTITQLKVDGTDVTSLPSGSSRISAVLFGESGGVISHVTALNIKTTGYIARTYSIDVSATGAARSVEIANNTVTDYARTAIQAQGASMTANIHDNVVTGPGTIGPDNVPNGIVFIKDAVGVANHNILHAMHYSGTGSRSGGLMAYSTTGVAGVIFSNNEVYDTDDAVILALNATHVTVGAGNNFHDNGVGVQIENGATNNTISGNTITGSTIAGIRLTGASDPAGAGTPPGAGNVAHNNSFSTNLIDLGDYDNTAFDASQNWWNSATGPTIPSNTSGVGGTITETTLDSVTYSPWYINTEMTVLSDATVTNATYTSTTEGQADLPNGATEVTLTDTTVMDLSSSVVATTTGDVVIGGSTVTLTQSVTLQSGVDTEPVVLTNSNLANVSVSIPDGATIQGPAEWDGTIMPPTDAPSEGTAPAGFTVGGTVISVGSPDGTLVFDQAVTILLAGVTGTVGYKPSGSNIWQTITATCSGTYDTPITPTAPGECSINNGTDTKIVTFHFTSFGGLDPIPPAPAPAPVLVGAVSGGFFALGPDGRLVILSSMPRPVTPPAPAVGQVLGESAFRFNNYLVRGSRGDDVTELQIRLTAEGVYSGPITGYFGSLTAQGVKNFQKKYGISQVGVVGPQTRAKLNSGVAVGTGSGNTIPGCAIGNKFNTTTGQSCPVQTSSGQGCAVGNKFNTSTGQACPVQ